MKKQFTLAAAFAVGLANTAVAQNDPDAMQLAIAVNACDGGEILSARFTDMPNTIAVRCANPGALGVAAGAPLIGSLGAVAGLTFVAAAIASSGGGSSTSDTQ